MNRRNADACSATIAIERTVARFRALGPWSRLTSAGLLKLQFWKSPTFVAAALMLAAAAPAPLQSSDDPGDMAAWHSVSAATGSIRGAAELSKLAKAFPDSSSVQLRLLNAALEEGDWATAAAASRRLAAMGYSLSPAALQELQSRVPAVVDPATRTTFASNRSAIAASGLFTFVPRGVRLVEDVAFDPVRNRLFVSSVADKGVFVSDGDGWRPLSGLRTGSVFGLAFDERRRLLWLSSGAVEQTPGPDTDFTGLIALDADTLKVRSRIAAPPGANVGDVELSADGTAYASDPNSGAIYRATTGDKRLTLLLPPGHLRSPQGMAASADGRLLYIADYRYGMAILDLASGQVRRLRSLSPMMLDGIDGLEQFSAGLIAIQNGTNPRRIVQLDLTEDGEAVSYLTVLEQAHPGWGEPTSGAVTPLGFLYVADAQWDAFGPGASVAEEALLRSTAIRVIRREVLGGMRLSDLPLKVSKSQAGIE